jgi:hypothetical protein
MTDRHGFHWPSRIHVENLPACVGETFALASVREPMSQTAPRFCLCALLPAILAGGVSAQPLGSPVVPTLDNPNRFAVAGVPAARRFFQLAAARRVDACIIGDSNTRANSCGHEAGMGLAFGARFGTYATAVCPVMGAGWWGATIASTIPYQFSPFIGDGAPPLVALWTFADGGFPAGYAQLDDGVLLNTTYNAGLTLLATNPIDIAGPLRYHATQWIFGSASNGHFNPTCRPAWPGDPTANYAAAPTITSAGPTRRLQDFSFDVPAGSRTPDGLLFCFADLAGARDARGPILLTWQRVENTSHASGIAYSPLWGMGGLSAYNACFELQSALTPLREWIRQATRIQNAPPVLLVQILHGGNDANIHAPSLGPIGGLDSSTPAGQEDNTRGIILAIRNAWTNSGLDPQTLFFLLGPYHPRTDVASIQPGYEQAWRTLAATDPQVFTLAGTMLSTPQELAARGLLSGGTDPSHLSAYGFQIWGRATLSALGRAICPADFNENGSLAVPDIFDFLNAWFALDKRADFNYSGTLEIQDIFDFLGAWFGGC